MIGIGTVVMKIAGRDAGRIGVVIGIKDGFVLIDGEVRRREVSVNHIEPAGQSVSVSEGASTEAVRDRAVREQAPPCRRSKTGQAACC